MFIRTLLLFAPPPPGGEVEGSVGGLILFISIALGISFLCSIWEAVVLSTSLSHVELLAQEGNRAGLLMRKHKQNLEQPISAILTLNTIAHTVGAAGAGAQAAALLGNELVGVISAVLTLLILIFSEIIPKTVGAAYWKQLMPFTAYSIQVLVWVMYPAIQAFHLLTRLIAPESDGPTITRSELEVMAQLSVGEGGLEEQENAILRNLLNLRAVQVRDIMTPRTVMLALQQDMTVAQVLARHRVLPYSRIPIYNENTDDITAFVLRYDILTAAAEDRDYVTLKELARPIHSVPETISVVKALNELILRQQHIFLVFDEYGGTAGIITLEDVVESLLGAEITDESDLVADLRTLAQQRYLRQRKLLGLVSDEPTSDASTAQ